MVRKAVQFGAGNIGRGFLGQLYFESGFETTFVDVSPELIDAINRRGSYPIRIVEDQPRLIQVERVRALHASDLEAVAQAVAEAEIAATAVGVNVLESVGKPLAAGIERRFSQGGGPLNVILAENKINAADFVRSAVRQWLSEGWYGELDKSIGFVEASIGRMVPYMTDALRREDPLLVCVEAYCELPVDAEAFRGPIPPIPHMLPKGNFPAYVERKLFVHNCGHATAAYLGFLRGHEYIWQSMTDPLVRTVVDGAMDETCRALSIRHGMSLDDLADHAEDLKRRFQNRALGDTVARVGADPVRKLGPEDRLIGSLRLCRETGIEGAHVAIATAAALRFDPPGDVSASQVQSMGVERALTEVCGLNPDDELRGLIRHGERRLRELGFVDC